MYHSCSLGSAEKNKSDNQLQSASSMKYWWPSNLKCLWKWIFGIQLDSNCSNLFFREHLHRLYKTLLWSYIKMRLGQIDHQQFFKVDSPLTPDLLFKSFKICQYFFKNKWFYHYRFLWHINLVSLLNKNPQASGFDLPFWLFIVSLSKSLL